MIEHGYFPDDAPIDRGDDLLRRRAVLEISPRVLADMCKAQGLLAVEVTRHPLPDDATVVACHVDPYRNVVLLTLVSRDFALVGHGQIPMTLAPPSTTRYHGEDAIVARLRALEDDAR